jgi:hypothetical protein
MGEYKLMDKVKSHKRFGGRFLGARPAVLAVVNHLKAAGIDAYENKSELAPSFDVHKDYRDSGDITARFSSSNNPNGAPFIVEVKGLTYQFTCEDDFPFPWMMVDNQPSYDAKPVEPLVTYVVSADLVHAAVVRLSTKPTWKVITRPIPNLDNYKKPIYHVPKGIPDYIKLNRLPD